MSRIVSRVIAVALSLLVVAPLSASATTPSPDRLGLSTSQDGPWSSTLDTPLFDPDLRWVPSDSETVGFWARNQSTDSTEFRITVVPQVQSLIDSGEFDVRMRADDGDWEPMRTAWAAPRPIAAGEQINIQIRASLPSTATNVSQILAFGFDIRTRMTYQGPAVPPSPTPTTPPADVDGTDEPRDPADPRDRTESDAARDERDDNNPVSHGALAGTGANQPGWVLPVGAGALITGIWMAVAARRRAEEESDVT